MVLTYSQCHSTMLPLCRTFCKTTITLLELSFQTLTRYVFLTPLKLQLNVTTIRFQNITTLPNHVEFALRYPAEMRTFVAVGTEFWNNWQTNRLFPAFDVPGLRNPTSEDGGYPANYYWETFASIQSAVSQAIVLEKSPDHSLSGIFLRVSAFMDS